MFEPLLQLVPTVFDGLDFREFRRDVPSFEVGPAQARNRTVSDSTGLALSTDVLPEILRVYVVRSVKKSYSFLAELVPQGL
jgi:hypothetical protein